MTGIKTPQEIIDRVVEMRSAGLSAQTVCAILDIPSSTASNIWTKHLREQTEDEPVAAESKEPSIDWQRKYAETQKQIAHLVELNDFLKEHILLLKSLR
jgi:orotate phosphoribosyltransferase-like protein